MSLAEGLPCEVYKDARSDPDMGQGIVGLGKKVVVILSRVKPIRHGSA